MLFELHCLFCLNINIMCVYFLTRRLLFYIVITPFSVFKEIFSKISAFFRSYVLTFYANVDMQMLYFKLS